MKAITGQPPKTSQEMAANAGVPGAGDHGDNGDHGTAEQCAERQAGDRAQRHEQRKSSGGAQRARLAQ